MQRKHAFLPFLLLLLAGCAQLGLEQPQTFRERAAYVHSNINGVVTATTNSLNAGAIQVADAEYVRETAVRIGTLLEAAETAYGSGDTTSAEKRLALAEGVLRQLQAFTGVKP